MAAGGGASRGEILDHLLSVWQAHAALGRDIPAAELCPETPELAAELEKRIRVVWAVGAIARPIGLTSLRPLIPPTPEGPADKTAPHQWADSAANGPPEGAVERGPWVRPLGDYEVLRELGRGGMGVVYQARHNPTGEVVALKNLQRLTPAGPYRFKQGFRVVAGLAHPNLIALRELGLVDVDRGT